MGNGRLLGGTAGFTDWCSWHTTFTDLLGGLLPCIFRLSWVRERDVYCLGGVDEHAECNAEFTTNDNPWDYGVNFYNYSHA